MIAVDTNILVYAHREEVPEHMSALAWLTRLAEDPLPWGLPVFCLGEFVRVVTHPRIFDPPTRLASALDALFGLLASPSLRVLNPGPRYPELFSKHLREADARGNLAFDTQIAAICAEHRVTALLTADRDFARFSKLKLLSLHDAPARKADAPGAIRRMTGPFAGTTFGIPPQACAPGYFHTPQCGAGAAERTYVSRESS